MVEDLRVVGRREVAVLLARRAVALHDAVDELAKAVLAAGGSDRAAEVLRRDDVGRVDRPEVRELHPALLEVDRAVAPVGHDHVAALPGHRVVRVHAGRRVDALDPQPALTPAASLGRADGRAAHRFGHGGPLSLLQRSAGRDSSATGEVSAGRIWVGRGCAGRAERLVRRRPRGLGAAQGAAVTGTFTGGGAGSWAPAKRSTCEASSSWWYAGGPPAGPRA